MLFSEKFLTLTKIMNFMVLSKQTVQSPEQVKCTHRIILWLPYPVETAEQNLDRNWETSPTRAGHKSHHRALQGTFSIQILRLLQLGNVSSVENWVHNVLLGSIFLNQQMPPALWAGTLSFNDSDRVPDEWLYKSMATIPQNVLFKTDVNVLHETLVKAQFGISHINPSQFTSIIFKSVTGSIQQFTAILFYLSLKVFNRGQTPNHQGYYECLVTSMDLFNSTICQLCKLLLYS